MSSRQPFGIIDAVLIVAIIGLIGLLVYVIWEPGQVLARMENMKWESRARMAALRTAEQQYFGAKGKYSATMDSLVLFINNDITPSRRDSLFKNLYMTDFYPDSLRFSPLGHKPYELAVDDTSSVKRYMITCPDGFGAVSSLTDPDEHNKASWEQ